MTGERFEIPVEAAKIAEVSAVFDEHGGARRESAILLAHGAGFSMDAPWMTTVAHGLRDRGFDVLRFNYPYRERAEREGRQRPPDRAEILERAHSTALGVLRERVGGRRILLAGKSMGGRMSTHLAAKGDDCAGLVLFGYPLHAPGRTDKLRYEHFAAIAQPALFLQGTRDKLCQLDLLEECLKKYGGKATVEVIEDADHGFHVRKASGRTDAEVLERMLDRIGEWDGEVFP